MHLMNHLNFIQPDILHQSLNAEHVLVSKDVLCRVTGFGFAENVLEREDHERTKGVWLFPMYTLTIIPMTFKD